MTGARFEVVIDFVMDDEKCSSPESCDKFLDNFLALLTEKFPANGVDGHVCIADLIVRSGSANSNTPIYKASVLDYNDSKHFS